MKPEKILDGHMYEISVGKTPGGGVKKTVVKVIEKNLVTKTWRCETQDGKEMKVKDPARFLKEHKEKEKAAAPVPSKSKTKTATPEAGVAAVPDSLKESLRAEALAAQKRAKIAAQALDVGIGHVTQKDVDMAVQVSEAAKEKARIAGVVFGGPSGRSNGRMGGKAAAYQVLLDEGRPMRAKELCDLAHERGYCELTGMTPDATVAAAIATDIKVHGDNSRFKRVDAGLFAANENFRGKGE